MLEEKNDNLPNEISMADGNTENSAKETLISENQEVEINSVEETIEEILHPIEETTSEIQPQEEAVSDTEIEETVLETEPIEEVVLESELIEETVSETEIEETVLESQPTEIIEEVEEIQPEIVDLIAEEQPKIEDANDFAVNEIANVNAEESEDETLKARHDIPLEDYEAMPMDQLISSLEEIVSVEKVMSVREHVEEIKKAFLSKYYHLIDEKRQEFLVENPETTEDFHYNFPLKSKFDQLYNSYKDKKTSHFKSLQNDLQKNLENRLAIVEELKTLIQSPENISASLKQLNDIRERWKVAGPIPKDKYNHVWNNYHFHIENFYDFLHLDREARDIEFKNNLDLKLKIITRVEELTHETDLNKSFRELQDLHRIWKEDIGPVSRDIREDIWKRFSELTKQMHDKREIYYESFRALEVDNLAKKNEIIAQLEVLSKEKVESHQAWLNQIVKVEALRESFFATGKVPTDVNEATWSSFKTTVRNFNVLKNSFYKDIKKDQNDNLSKKQALVAKANELKVSEDFAVTTPLMKQIQEEWKQVGHVPRKYSDELWNEFKAACNEYFDRLKNSKKEEDSEEVAAFEKKKEFMEIIRSFELVGDHKTDLDAIKAHIETWKSFGKVPFNRRHIEGKFNKILDALFEKLSLSKKDTEKMRFANKLDSLGDDSRKLENEAIFIRRRIEEVQNEIFQLENNIQFFQNTKNAKKENSIVTEVRKTIERHKEELVTWKDKLKQLREVQQ